MAVREAGEEVAQVGVGLDAVHFTGADQAGKPSPIAAPFIVPGKERIAAVHGRSADRVFHEVGVDIDVAIVQERTIWQGPRFKGQAQPG